MTIKRDQQLDGCLIFEYTEVRHSDVASLTITEEYPLHYPIETANKYARDATVIFVESKLGYSSSNSERGC